MEKKTIGGNWRTGPSRANAERHWRKPQQLQLSHPSSQVNGSFFRLSRCEGCASWRSAGAWGRPTSSGDHAGGCCSGAARIFGCFAAAGCAAFASSSGEAMGRRSRKCGGRRCSVAEARRPSHGRSGCFHKRSLQVGVFGAGPCATQSL